MLEYYLLQEIRRLRELNGYSPTLMATKCGVGKETYLVFELGQGMVDFELVNEIAKVFGMKTSQLIVQAEERMSRAKGK